MNHNQTMSLAVMFARHYLEETRMNKEETVNQLINQGCILSKEDINECVDEAAQLIIKSKIEEIVDDICNKKLNSDIIQAEINQHDINLPSFAITLDNVLLETVRSKIKDSGYSIEALVSVFIQQINKRL